MRQPKRQRAVTAGTRNGPACATHDGVPGTDDGFGYRAIYVAPELIIRATDGRALPFVAEPVQRAVPATRSMASVLADIDEPIDDLRSAAVVATIADCLWSLSGHLSSDVAPVDVTAVNIVREYLAAHARERIVAATLWSFGTFRERGAAPANGGRIPMGSRCPHRVCAPSDGRPTI
jgi:hypothetical protein